MPPSLRIVALMQIRPIAALCLALTSGFTQAQVTTAEADRALYLEFLERHSQAAVCSERLPDFSDKYAPLLRKFKVRNEYVLRLGDAFVRAEAVRDQITIEEKIEKATRAAVSKLEAASEVELQKECNQVLRWFDKREDKPA
mgnify:CR=1 FL=1